MIINPLAEKKNALTLQQSGFMLSAKSVIEKKKNTNKSP